MDGFLLLMKKAFNSGSETKGIVRFEYEFDLNF